MKYKVFIGYSSNDNDKAQSIYDCLSRIVEITPYKAEIFLDYGEDFRKRIMSELENSRFVVVLLTNNGVSNQWVNQEIGYACALKKRQRLLAISGEEPQIIPISESQIELKGFITKDSVDILFLDKLPWELVIANVILKIRSYIPRGLGKGTLHFKVVCPNCTDTRGLPFEFSFPMDDYETINKAIELGKNFLVPCPKCGTPVYIDVRTFLPLKIQ